MENTMATTHDLTDNIVYDLVSIQYHALQANESYTSYLDDVHSADHRALTEFIMQCREQDRHRVQRCHELIAELTER
jgi:hypothetical protein